MVAYSYRMDVGYAGAVNRAHDATVQPEMIHAAAPPGAFGLALTLDAASGGVRAPGAAGEALVGLYVKPFPMQGGAVNDPLYTATPPTSGVANVMRRGYMTVQLVTGSPPAVKGAPVGVWIGAAAAGVPQGGVTAAAPGANVAAAPAIFRGAADAKGMTEIEWNL